MKKIVTLCTIVFLILIMGTQKVSAITIDKTTQVQLETNILDIDVNFFGNLETVKCGKVDMPKQIPEITRIVVTLIKIAVPLILIVMGMLDMLQATIASDEKKMTEARSKFVKRLISASVVFLVITIIQLIVGIIAPEESTSLLKCIACMVSDASSCG